MAEPGYTHSLTAGIAIDQTTSTTTSTTIRTRLLRMANVEMKWKKKRKTKQQVKENQVTVKDRPIDWRWLRVSIIPANIFANILGDCWIRWDFVIPS